MPPKSDFHRLQSASDLGNSSGVTADYLERLGVALEGAMQAGPPETVTELLRSGFGATPDVILAWMEAAYGRRHIPRSSLPCEPMEALSPELHPLLFEWYFDRSSTEFISELIHGAEKDVLCMGVPSVAAELCRSANVRSVTLIDADEGVLPRFPDLRVATVHIGEIASFSPNDKYDITVADPPWYLSDVTRWLNIAQLYTKAGGTIILPIFPPLTRPSSLDERDTLFAAANKIGETELWSNRLIYRTPLFEEEAFRAMGLGDVGDWRRADLLVLRNVRPQPVFVSEEGAHFGLDGWHRFEIGNQVVMLRDEPTVAQANSIFVPVPGCPHNVLTSVSDRDPRRKLVGIWTSRNRVASVGNVAQAAEMLLRMAGDQPLHIDPSSSSSHMFLSQLVSAH